MAKKPAKSSKKPASKSKKARPAETALHLETARWLQDLLKLDTDMQELISECEPEQLLDHASKFERWALQLRLGFLLLSAERAPMPPPGSIRFPVLQISFN